MKLIEGSETSAFKPQTPGKYPKENILHIEHGESLKSRHHSLCIIHSVPSFLLSVMHLSLEIIMLADMCKYIFFLGRKKIWKLLKTPIDVVVEIN